MKLNLGCGPAKLVGFINLDKKEGWSFQDGLEQDSNVVEAITISHALMYLESEGELITFLKEAYRVLQPGGIIRITEDNTLDRKFFPKGAYKDAVLITHSPMMDRALTYAGFKVMLVGPDNSNFKDDSLIQRLHGDVPRVYHIEGIKK